jgi:hypothetical protein
MSQTSFNWCDPYPRHKATNNELNVYVNTTQFQSSATTAQILKQWRGQVGIFDDPKTHHTIHSETSLIQHSIGLKRSHTHVHTYAESAVT